MPPAAQSGYVPDITDNPIRKSGPNVPGKLAFTAARLADPAIQLAFLNEGYAAQALNKLGWWRATITPIASSVGLNSFRTLGRADGYLTRPGNVYYPPRAYYAFFTHTAGFPVTAALGISAYNTALNIVNSLVLAYRFAYVSGAQTSDWKQYTGLALVVAGALVEIVSEEQRKSFKAKSENKGKLCDEGLFGLVRHPNYFGYTIWRTGLALSTGSVINAAVNFAFQLGALGVMSVNEISSYLDKRYGVEFNNYKTKVPYKMIPYIY